MWKYPRALLGIIYICDSYFEAGRVNDGMIWKHIRVSEKVIYYLELCYIRRIIISGEKIGRINHIWTVILHNV